MNTTVQLMEQRRRVILANLGNYFLCVYSNLNCISFVMFTPTRSEFIRCIIFYIGFIQ